MLLMDFYFHKEFEKLEDEIIEELELDEDLIDEEILEVEDGDE